MHCGALESLYQRALALGGDLKQALKRYAWLYNQYIPQKTLHHQPSIAMMKEWTTKHPRLFSIYQTYG